jgi:hypothetical protein
LGQGPQFTFEGHAVSGTHAGRPQTEGVPPPPHVSPAGQAGQVYVPPQPSLTGPQRVPPVAEAQAVASGIFVHAGCPHTEGLPPPPQVSPAVVHAPQEAIVPPHPFDQGPQLIPGGHAVAGVQVGALASRTFTPPSGRGRIVDEPHTL